MSRLKFAPPGKDKNPPAGVAALKAVRFVGRKQLLAVLKVLVGATLLYWLVRQVDSKGVVSLILDASLPELAAGVICLVLAVSSNAVRWNAVVTELGSRLPLTTSFVGTFEGMFFNLFLPTSVGGDAVRAYRAFDRGLSAPVAIESALIDRAIGLWGVGLSLLAAGPWASAARQVANYGSVITVSTAIVVGGATVAIVGKFLIDPTRFKSWMRPLATVVHNYGQVVISTRFVAVILPSLLANTLLTGSAMWLMVGCLHLNLSFADAMIVLQGSTLAALLPVSFGGWGVREGVVVFLLLATGIDMTSAVAASLLFGFGLAVLGLLGAVVWLGSPYRGLVRFSDMRPRSLAARGAAPNDKRNAE